MAWINVLVFISGYEDRDEGPHTVEAVVTPEKLDMEQALQATFLSGTGNVEANIRDWVADGSITLHHIPTP